MGAWLICTAALPMVASAQTGPLLSGYGAPGQGNQVILGSALLGGTGGGTSSGSGGPGGLAAAASASHAAGAAAGPGAGPGDVSRATHSGSSGSSARRAGAAGGSAPPHYPAAEPAAATSPALGLSGTDVLYIVLAVTALGLTGVLTQRLVRAGPGQEPR